MERIVGHLEIGHGGISIKQSRDYKRFRFLPANREVSESHVRKLAEYMAEVGFLPYRFIIVTTFQGVEYVVSGQARYRAAERAGVDFYYVKDPQKYSSMEEIMDRVMEEDRLTKPHPRKKSRWAGMDE